jgi:hypothetical protein
VILTKTHRLKNFNSECKAKILSCFFAFHKIAAGFVRQFFGVYGHIIKNLVMPRLKMPSIAFGAKPTSDIISDIVNYRTCPYFAFIVFHGDTLQKIFKEVKKNIEKK